MSIVALSKRILAADPALCVGDIVAVPVMLNLPQGIAMPFAHMRIDWQDNRAWGESFRLGATRLRLGHRRGDHVAQHPELTGWAPEDAAEMLRQQIEGSCLHELGHALIDFAQECAPKIGARATEVLARLGVASRLEGPVSTYTGHGPMARPDQLHEEGAEAFRWWCVAPAAFSAQYPVWGTTIGGIIRLCGGLT